MTGSLGDIFDGMFGQPSGFEATELGRAAAASRKDAAKPTPANPDAQLPQIRGKRIDDVLYVRAEDVAEALQRIVPTEASKLIKKLRGGPQ